MLPRLSGVRWLMREIDGLAVRRQGREYRLDAIRGLALLFVFVDHCEYATGVEILSSWTLHAWYWADAAEVFVFVAGSVCGRSYLRSLEQGGFVACQRKALKRARDIYLTNLACLAIIVGMAKWFGPPPDEITSRLRYEGLDHAPWAVALASISMTFQPLAVDVLTLYVQFVITLPLLLACWKRWPIATTLLCLEAYLVAQWFECVNLPRWPTDVYTTIGCGRHFHHVAWNAFFFLGALVAVDRIRIENRIVIRGLFLLCVLGIVTIVSTSIPVVVEHCPFLASVGSWKFSELSSKLTLGPIRLVAFLMLAVVVSSIFTEARCRQLHCICAPFIVLGKNSLLVYSLGLVFTHASWLLAGVMPLEREWHNLSVLTYEMYCIGIMLVASWWREKRRNACEA